MSGTTPRAKALPKGEGGTPRAKPAVKKVKKKIDAKAVTVEVQPSSDAAALPVEEARSKYAEVQAKYQQLVHDFNEQQADIKQAQREYDELKEKVAKTRAKNGGSQMDDQDKQIDTLMRELRLTETNNMALQKKVNKLQVEHVSEEEVDQLFYALEQKEMQLEEAMKGKEDLEQEVNTARQLSARAAGNEAGKYIEIHHHNDMSEEDDDDVDDAKANAPAAPPVEVS